ncbi:hypothetical protein WMY93_028457 [Mugilogobius chulae]|uniref:Uncharacterized protein n=1 Tax=Mugilogobius chulae TaxID=88201 RepID=A0AAW0MV49_9GOBI
MRFTLDHWEQLTLSRSRRKFTSGDVTAARDEQVFLPVSSCVFACVWPDSSLTLLQAGSAALHTTTQHGSTLLQQHNTSESDTPTLTKTLQNTTFVRGRGSDGEGSVVPGLELGARNSLRNISMMWLTQSGPELEEQVQLEVETEEREHELIHKLRQKPADALSSGSSKAALHKHCPEAVSDSTHGCPGLRGSPLKSEDRADPLFPELKYTAAVLDGAVTQRGVFGSAVCERNKHFLTIDELEDTSFICSSLVP